MNTKLTAALIIIGVSAVAVVGLVSAQISTSTPSSNVSKPDQTQSGNYWGWMNRYLQYGGELCRTQSSTSRDQLAPIDPNTDAKENQNYYGYGCNGRHMRGFNP